MCIIHGYSRANYDSTAVARNASPIILTLTEYLVAFSRPENSLNNITRWNPRGLLSLLPVPSVFSFARRALSRAQSRSPSLSLAALALK